MPQPRISRVCGEMAQWVKLTPLEGRPLTRTTGSGKGQHFISISTSHPIAAGTPQIHISEDVSPGYVVAFRGRAWGG